MPPTSQPKTEQSFTEKALAFIASYFNGMKQEAPPEQQTSSLLTLPGELRNRIYALAIDDHVSSIGARRWRDLKQFRQPPLFRTCQLLRAEGLDIYYNEHVIVERYDRESADWHLLSGREALGTSLRPYKYGFETRYPGQGRLTPEDVRWYIETDLATRVLVGPGRTWWRFFFMLRFVRDEGVEYEDRRERGERVRVPKFLYFIYVHE